ncbi:MAG: pantoate--beta-alanine ligase [Pseudomonadales bacterium]
MRIVRTIADWQALRSARGASSRGDKSIGFVPTMGALHAGHAALIERSVAENRFTVLSIFVNPTQFNNATDLEHYPDTLDDDLALATELGVDAVLLPSYQELYADDYRFQVLERQLSSKLCGEHRPGHFDGVMTVVLKLLNLVKPNRAYFGEKDYQQYELVRDMCAAFLLDVDIVPCPTVRELDGLAMSSRNLRLTPEDRARAPQLAQQLRRDVSDDAVIAELTALGFNIDYVVSRAGRRFGAASLGSGANQVRLIDNVPLASALAEITQLKPRPSTSTELAEAG